MITQQVYFTKATYVPNKYVGKGVIIYLHLILKRCNFIMIIQNLNTFSIIFPLNYTPQIYKILDNYIYVVGNFQ